MSVEVLHFISVIQVNTVIVYIHTSRYRTGKKWNVFNKLLYILILAIFTCTYKGKCNLNKMLVVSRDAIKEWYPGSRF